MAVTKVSDWHWVIKITIQDLPLGADDVRCRIMTRRAFIS